MRRRIAILSIVGLLSILFVSCNNDEDRYSLGKVWISMGIIDTINTYGYDFVIYCDNGDTLLPAANAAINFEATNNQRVIANYTKLGDVSNTKQMFYVKVNNLNKVLFKELIELNNEVADSLGNDPVMISDMWLKNDMLNIEFMYAGSYKTHYINLAYKTNDQGVIEQPVELVFKHNDNNDENHHLLNGIVTFRLNAIKFENLDETHFVVKWIDYHDEEHQMTGTYKYNN